MKIVGRETFVDVVRERAAGASRRDLVALPRRPVTSTGETVTLTFGELARRATAIAAELQRHGEAGDRALLLFPSGLEFVTAFFGCLFAGMVPVPAYPPDLAKPERTLAKLYAIAADCRPRFALTTAEYVPMLERGRTARRALPRDRHVRSGVRAAWRAAGAHARQHRVHPVHVGLDRRAEGRGAAPSPGHGEPALDRGGDGPGRDRRRLAADLSRHGPDRERAADAVRGHEPGADVAGLVLEATGALARGDLALPRDDERRPELRVRAVRAPGQRRGARAARPRQLEGRVLRRGAGARSDVSTVHRGVRAARVLARRVLSVLRPRRGDAVRDRASPRHATEEPRVPELGARSRRGRRARRGRRRRSPRAGQLRHARAERGDPDRRSGHAARRRPASARSGFAVPASRAATGVATTTRAKCSARARRTAMDRSCAPATSASSTAASCSSPAARRT